MDVQVIELFPHENIKLATKVKDLRHKNYYLHAIIGIQMAVKSIQMDEIISGNLVKTKYKC